MTATDSVIPARLQEIVAEFQESEREEKLELLLEFADKLPPLPDWLHEQREQMQPVPECMTPIFLHTELENGGMVLYFDVPAEAPTVRGYAEVLREGFTGAAPEAVVKVSPAFFHQMGIQHVVGPQRLNGMMALLAHIKRHAFQYIRR